MGSPVTNDPVVWLYGLQSHGVKLGLDGIRSLLALLDHPESAYPSVLVGGTNGKGSVSAMLDAMLGASGRRTGLYTSPHLVRPNERIRIAGQDIATPELHRVLEVVRASCEVGLAEGSLAAHPSFFEVMTAAALCAFRDAGVDVAVLEVGLGGRLDATNATEPLVSAIVTVNLDTKPCSGRRSKRSPSKRQASPVPGVRSFPASCSVTSSPWFARGATLFKRHLSTRERASSLPACGSR